MLEKELRITKLETQRRNRDRISIYINDEFVLGVHKSIIYKFNIEEGNIVDRGYIEKVIGAQEQKRAKDYAVKLLSHRQRSQREIEDKMEQKGYDGNVINKTLKWLKEYGLINDEDFAKEFVISKSKNYGSKRIRIELSRKGVEEGIIDDILNREVDCEREYDIALECAKKKIKAYRGEKRDAVYRKLGSYLQRRGFSYDIICKVLREVMDF